MSKNQNAAAADTVDKVESAAPTTSNTAGPNPLIDMNGLAQLVATAVASASTESQKQQAEMFSAFVDALRESKKPYVDPRNAENERRIREQDAAAAARRDESIKAAQENCPHLQGSNELSEFQGQLTSIAWHRQDTGRIVGVCTNCIRTFKPGDPDYKQWMAKKSGNRLSQAGQRFSFVPNAA